MEIELNDYEYVTQCNARAKAAELLGINENEVVDYIERNYQWCQNSMEYQYMGYDCGDCYMGGDIKMGIICGDYLVIYATCPTYKVVTIMKKKH